LIFKSLFSISGSLSPPHSAFANVRANIELLFSLAKQME
jgi:hypothetical protein